MEIDALALSRIQFAFTMSFTALAATLSIGLATWLVVLEGLWLTTGKRRYKRLYDYWLTLFAVVFALACVSGVAVIYQFGSNWSRFTEATANLLGPLLGFAVLAIVFLRVSFFPMMVSGGRHIGRGLHFLATCIVALGTLAAAFWIVSADSWMHAPSGYEFREGAFFATDWAAAIFNPTFAYRFTHMVLAAWCATAFVVAGVGAWLLLRRRARREAMLMMRAGLTLACILVPAQLISGYENGLSVYRHQPAEHAAIQGHWQTREGNAPLILFAWPDQDAARNVGEISIPGIGGLLATGDYDGTVYGLLEWAPEDWPDVAVVFWSFRVMVGIGLAMALLAPLGAWGAWRGWIQRSRAALALYVLMIPSGLAAVLAGWATAQAGRQPFAVYGVMRTADAASPLSGEHVALSLAVFVAVYAGLFLFGAGTLARIADAGPKVPHRPEPDPEPEPAVAAAPVFAEPRHEDEEACDEDDGEEEKEDLDALSDEELERLTSPFEEDDDEADDRRGVSAHDRLFMPDEAVAESDDLGEDVDEEFTDRHPHSKDREPNDGNP